MLGKELCPHCGSKQYTQQPVSHRQSQDVFYECGNAMTFDFGERGELLLQTDHGGCKNKVEWENILVPYGEEFDNNAKNIDKRFFGWIEYLLFFNHHGVGWKNKYPQRACTDKEFVDKYFDNKEQYLASVKSINENPIYANPIYTPIVTKDYPDWIGPVSMQEVKRFTTDGVETLIFRVISSEWNQDKVGGYVVERNPIGGGDQGRDFYRREILDIIIKEETKK